MATSLLTAGDLYQKMKWLVLCRFLFAVLLFSSTLFFHINHPGNPLVVPLLILYLLIIGLFVLSLSYYVLLKIRQRGQVLAYTQIIIDTIFVTCIVFLTGGFLSIFSFLYILVIIYSSILLYRKGSIIMATLCSVQYYAMVQLEYAGVLTPVFGDGNLDITQYSASQIFYRIGITVAACYAVAFLSSLLSEQARKTKNELLAIEEQMKRVEKLAYVGEMAAHLAHEIKNPLASLAGSIQLLREEIQYDPDHDRLMQIILRETDRLSALSNNFLLCARPQTGKPEKINLGKALNETIALFQKDKILEKGIDLESQIDSDIWIQSDPTHLRQILWNLLLNSAEAIRDKGTITIQAKPVKDNHVEISIGDDGCGIEEKMIDSIFNPFFTTKPSGTGLGLSIVHRLLESNNSILEVDSEVNKGTIMRFKLKIIDPPIRQLELDTHE